MTGEVVRAHPGTSLRELVRLLAFHRISGVPVVDGDDKVVGVVSRTDLAERRTAHPSDRPDRKVVSRAPGRTARTDMAGPVPTAGELMTTPAVTVHPEQRVVDAARIMERCHIDRLPVVDEEDRLIGISTRRDLLRVFLRTDAEIRTDVTAEVAARLPGGRVPSVVIGVRDGLVRLDGHTGPAADTAAMIGAVWRVDGVVGVMNRLTAEPRGGGEPHGGAPPSSG